MQDLNFDCPGCGQNLDAPVKMAGMKIHCPGCGQVLQLPYPSEIETQEELEKAKAATTRIDTSRGGLVPAQPKRFVFIPRSSGPDG